MNSLKPQARGQSLQRSAASEPCAGRDRRGAAKGQSQLSAPSVAYKKLSLILAVALTFGLSGAKAQAPDFSGAAQSSNPHAVSLYNLGWTAYKQGSPESAIIFFRRACDIDPNLADAQYNLGVIYQSEKRLNEAVPRFQEVLRVKPADPDAHYQLGLCFIDLGRLPDARQILGQIPPSDKHFAEAQKRISLIDQQPNQLPPATTPTLAAPQATPPQTIAPQTVPPQTAETAPLSPPISNPDSTGQRLLPAATPTQDAAQLQPQPPRQVVETPQNEAPATPATPAKPVPILANSTVRVIATGFSAPSGLAFDRTGNLYIANYASDTIDRISPDGTKATFSSGSNLKGPIGVAVDPTGNVYVANYKGGTIVRINPAGVSTVIATGFRKPYYLTMDDKGNLFVSQQADNSIVCLSLPRPIGAKP
jgi:tetratricopeptide (TPR) repeat protein